METNTDLDIQNQFKILNTRFNDLMSAENYNCKDGKVLTILKKMLKMIIEKNHIIHMQSIINTQLLLTNLHRALTDLEQFPVISTENLPDLNDHQLCRYMEFSFVPAEGETSLQTFTKEGCIMDPVKTFSGVERSLWPEVNASHEPNEYKGALPELVFYIRGKEQDFRFSLYQALLSQYWRDDNDFDVSTGLWPPIQHKITYRRSTSYFDRVVEDFSDLEKESQVILQFLSRICNLGIECPEAFVNNGLDEKLNKQLDDKFVRVPRFLPPWWIYAIITYPFLFSYQTRIRFFKLVAYYTGNPIFLETMANMALNKEKTVFVSRNHILGHAKQLMDQHAREAIELRVSFLGEIGTGVGPTSEFYTLVSEEFQKCDLMWRKDKTFGLFPSPRLASSIEQVKTKFVLLGQIVGKAIQNGKLLDIHFSKAFYKLILGKELSIYDIQSFEPHLGKTLLEFKEFVSKLTESDLRYKGGSIEDLCLSFVLPGYEEFSSEYKKDVPVDLINLEDYVSFVKDGTIGSGITVQMEAFNEGFMQAFQRDLYPTAIRTFSIFTEEEFEANLCGQTENSWSLEELKEHITFGGGYMEESVPIVNLFEILQGFNLEQRRGFLQFVTATPRLPYGGLASLNPSLRVEQIFLTEESLPCAATCTNKLFLPPYLSKDTMKEKLLYAITEGQGSFSYI